VSAVLKFASNGRPQSPAAMILPAIERINLALE